MAIANIEVFAIFDLTIDAGIDQRILAERRIVYSELPAYREITQHMISQHLGAAPSVRFICQNLLSVLTLLQQSDCLCVLPHLAVEFVKSPRIVPIDLPLQRNTAEVGLIFRSELGDWAPMQTLVALSREKFRVTEEAHRTLAPGP